MSIQSGNSRRQFLRNTALATLSAGLLPDVLKANNPAFDSVDEDCFPTTQDYYGQGPFYTAGAPIVDNNKLASDAEPGTRLILSGVVRTIDCSMVIGNAIIDAWQANHDGASFDRTSSYANWTCSYRANELVTAISLR